MHLEKLKTGCDEALKVVKIKDTEAFAKIKCLYIIINGVYVKKHEQGYGIFGDQINILTSIKLIITKNLSKLWAENYKIGGVCPYIRIRECT